MVEDWAVSIMNRAGNLKKNMGITIYSISNINTEDPRQVEIAKIIKEIETYIINNKFSDTRLKKSLDRGLQFIEVTKEDSNYVVKTNTVTYKDYGDLCHEVLHASSSDIDVSDENVGFVTDNGKKYKGINEGTTEYISSILNHPSGNGYTLEKIVAENLDKLSDNKLQKAYFEGDIKKFIVSIPSEKQQQVIDILETLDSYKAKKDLCYDKGGTKEDGAIMMGYANEIIKKLLFLEDNEQKRDELSGAYQNQLYAISLEITALLINLNNIASKNQDSDSGKNR